VNIQRKFIETEDDWSGIMPVQEYDFVDVLGVKQ
jgi:hypothetical protein